MNIRTNLLEDCVDDVDITTKENTFYSKTLIVLFVLIISSFLFLLLNKYLKGKHFFSRTNI